MYTLYKRLSEEDFSFAYLDNFTDKATDALVSIQDARINPDKAARRKIRYLVTECFQNVIRHSQPKYNSFDKLFAVRSKGNHHAVVSINPVDQRKVNELGASIDSLKKLSEKELKAVYLDALQGKGFNKSGGAGLGLIEMARKSKKVPNYTFHRVDNDTSEFQFELAFHTQKTGVNDVFDIDTTEFYHYLKSNKVLILQKGQFSQDVVMSLFELLEGSLKNNIDSSAVSQKLYLVIELLQNMSNYSLETAKGKSGIFQIKLGEKGETIFETGNYLSNAEADNFNSHLIELKNLGKIELLKRYNKELRKGLKENDKPNAGIGIMEMLKLTQGNLDYHIEPIDDKKSFIVLTATVQ